MLSSTGASYAEAARFDVDSGWWAIGVEFAHIVSSFGVKVTIVEMMDRILPGEDAEVSRASAPIFCKERNGYSVGTKAVSMERRSEGAEVVWRTGRECGETISWRGVGCDWEGSKHRGYRFGGFGDKNG